MHTITSSARQVAFIALVRPLFAPSLRTPLMYSSDRQIATSWVSHRKRLFYLTLLHHFVMNYEIGNRPESEFSQFRRTGSTLFYGGRLLHGHMAAEQHKRHLVQFTMMYGPPDINHFTVKELLAANFGGKAIYDTPRWRKLFVEMEGSTKSDEGGSASGSAGGVRYRIRLATVASLAGVYRVFVTGRFVVGKSAQRTTVELLNGYVKVEENTGRDEGRQYTCQVMN